MRADSHRILIVAPGSLVEQWRDELFEKFGLEFHIYSIITQDIQLESMAIVGPNSREFILLEQHTVATTEMLSSKVFIIITIELMINILNNDEH